MKELEKLQRELDKVNMEISVNKQKAPVEYTYDSSLYPMRGHQLWEINLITQEVKRAEYMKREVIGWFEALADYLNPTKTTKEVVKKKDCVYISALNAENALKRYLSASGSASTNKRDFIFS